MKSHQRMEKWKKVRENGKKHYIINYGILGWGLSTGILFILYSQLVGNGLQFLQYTAGDWVAKLLLTLGIFLLGGVLFGYATWQINERFYYKRYAAARSTY
ncbi:hypothetical protein [Halobacillus massiliensis]|uniref:hypothetical protein n=1 Tax=Halobacillus massiliensis TaxID=1926286 RepID=UPI0009E409CE|nr:hypothetical protein [Halobacillus massiliensis]